MKRSVALLICLSFVLSANAFAVDIPPAFSREAVGAKFYPPPPRIAAAASMAPAVDLGAAEPSDLEEVYVWNDEGRRPAKNGFTRTMPDLVSVRLTGAVASKGMQSGGIVATSDRGTVVWSGRFRIAAYRVRLRLDHAKLPDGAVLWIYNDSGEPIAFDRNLIDTDGGLWTPSVNGGIVNLEVEIPMPKSEAGAASFEINKLLEIVPPRPGAPRTNDDAACLINAQCVTSAAVPDIDSFKRGVAHLEYIKNGSSFSCSGGLLNDLSSSGTPWLLTANFCFDTQAAATSLEAYWDWLYASCTSTVAPPLPTSTRSNGATLIATNTSSGFTFVRLDSIPANRYFFGTTTITPDAGTLLHRLSHPAPASLGKLPQMYSASTFNTTFEACTAAPRPNFIYSIFTSTQGGTSFGSSGAPVIAYFGGGPRLIGHHVGYCGQTPDDHCDTSNKIVDGAFATTWTSISQFLTAPPAACAPTSTTLCLNNDRFKVQATYQTGSGQSGQAQVVKLTSDTGYLWFFSSTNVEVVIKVLNACGINGWWVFAGGLTDVRVTLTVTDTKTGNVKQYTNPLGQPFQPIQDTSAFSVCP